MAGRNHADHALNFLIAKAVGLPPRRASDEWSKWYAEERVVRMDVAQLRKSFDRLIPEAQRFIVQYLTNGLNPAEAVQDAEILTVNRSQGSDPEYVQYLKRAKKIMRDPSVQAVIDSAIRVGRMDRPNSPRLRAVVLAAVDGARSSKEKTDALAVAVRFFGKEVVADGAENAETGFSDDLLRKARALESGIAAGLVDTNGEVKHGSDGA